MLADVFGVTADAAAAAGVEGGIPLTRSTTSSSSNINNVSAGDASSTRRVSFTLDQAREGGSEHVVLRLICFGSLARFSMFVFRDVRCMKSRRDFRKIVSYTMK